MLKTIAMVGAVILGSNAVNAQVKPVFDAVRGSTRAAGALERAAVRETTDATIRATRSMEQQAAREGLKQQSLAFARAAERDAAARQAMRELDLAAARRAEGATRRAAEAMQQVRVAAPRPFTPPPANTMAARPAAAPPTGAVSSAKRDLTTALPHTTGSARDQIGAAIRAADNQLLNAALQRRGAGAATRNVSPIVARRTLPDGRIYVRRANGRISYLPGRKPKALADPEPAIESAVPDISERFTFRPRWRQGGFEYEEISGRLGVPGKVLAHRSSSAQKGLSSGTGDHAGHRIASRFGAPPDARNMSLQNANVNTYAPKALQERFGGSGGTYLELEDAWEAKLKSGTAIDVRVRDRYKHGDARPHSRLVEWTETSPDGTKRTYQLDFLNMTSPQSRDAQ